MTVWPTTVYGNLDRAADELEHILTAALARLDARHQRAEETSMGGCYQSEAA